MHPTKANPYVSLLFIIHFNSFTQPITTHRSNFSSQHIKPNSSGSIGIEYQGPFESHGATPVFFKDYIPNNMKSKSKKLCCVLKYNHGKNRCWRFARSILVKYLASKPVFSHASIEGIETPLAIGDKIII
jgi:hypothetical protein